MREKITLEQFNSILSEIKNYRNAYNNCVSNEILGLKDRDYAEEKANAYSNYEKKIKEILSYDLSNIEYINIYPLTECFDISEKPIDLSYTHANISFSLSSYSPNINYKSCNIKEFIMGWAPYNPKQFDSSVVNGNEKYFLMELYPLDIKNKMFNHELSIKDLSTLNDNQISEIENKKFFYIFDEETLFMIQNIGFSKIINLYLNDENEYVEVYENLRYMINQKEKSLNFKIINSMYDELRNCEIKDLRKILFKYIKIDLESKNRIEIENLPKSFVENNKDFLLINDSIPEDFRKRFYNRELTIDDVFDYIDLFKESNLGMVKNSRGITAIVSVLGYEEFRNSIKKYPKEMKYIIKGEHYDRFVYLVTSLKENNSYEISEAIKEIFKRINSISNKSDLLLYDPSFFELPVYQKQIVDTLGLDNIKKFEKETSYFSNNEGFVLPGLYLFEKMFAKLGDNRLSILKSVGIDFENGTLSYEDFRNEMAKLIDYSKNFLSTDIPWVFTYDFIKGKFREEHPELFMDDNAKEQYKKWFYEHKITLSVLHDEPDIIPYLKGKKLSNTINCNIKWVTYSLTDNNGFSIPKTENFIEIFQNKFGDSILNLLAKYGNLLENISIYSNGEVNTLEDLDKVIRDSIYKKILKEKPFYQDLFYIKEFREEHPDIFLSYDELESIQSEEDKKDIIKSFYSGSVLYQDIQRYPILKEILKNKNLSLIMRKQEDYRNYSYGRVGTGYAMNQTTSDENNDIIAFSKFDNGKILELCSLYGRYMRFISYDFETYGFAIPDDFDELKNKIEELITLKCKKEGFDLKDYDAPEFLKRNNPELFLDEDAPVYLRKIFYGLSSKKQFLNFSYLCTYEEEWKDYLKGKDIVAALLRNDFYKKHNLLYFIELFGKDKAISLGIKKHIIVDEMLQNNQISKLKFWFDKTGGRFIPDIVIMRNIPEDEADKFVTSTNKWNKLMCKGKIKFLEEYKEAVLKIAYSFGVFDNDQKGFKEVCDLILNPPLTIDPNKTNIIEELDNVVDFYSHREELVNNIENKDYISDEDRNKILNKMSDILFEDYPVNRHEDEAVINFLKELSRKNIDIDITKPIFSQIYKLDNIGLLRLNPKFQKDSYLSYLIRDILQEAPNSQLISKDKAHQLFGSFNMKYDPDFRDFFLKYYDEIVLDDDNIKILAGIQKNFKQIKTVNSNRTLTLDLAISYLHDNKYIGVEVGNEKVAKISAIAGYSQEEFDILQQIYYYGKQRTFSSIPKINDSYKGNNEEYHYEILRLDDPLAMAIGTLTDCCQEINNAAEACMEHSMVDKNGRVFIIRDSENNIVSQSWVWRNRDILCFDNIEIPHKAFVRASKKETNEEFTDEVFNIYKKASKELIEIDEKTYRNLYDEKIISKEQYDGLRLGKVTVGIGYNDIANSLKKNAEIDIEKAALPPRFDDPISLGHKLYTSDSRTQYILEKREDRKPYKNGNSNDDTITPYRDDFIIYNDSNFKKKDLLFLQKLELLTKEEICQTDIDSYEYDYKDIVTNIAINYDLDPDKTNIIMNPNFAIIYETNNNNVRIGDILFNTETGRDARMPMAMQIKLALDEISDGKEIILPELNEEQKKMYRYAYERMDRHIDIERGIYHAR